MIRLQGRTTAVVAVLFVCAALIVMSIVRPGAHDSLGDAKSDRTIAEVETVLRSGLALSDLLTFVDATPIVTGDSIRVILHDGDLWIQTKHRQDGMEIVSGWAVRRTSEYERDSR
jgi:hypothetical protein